MTESRSSVSSESLSTELVAKLFNALPDEKPEELSEFEYCLFRLFAKLSSIPQNHSLFSFLFLFFSWLQSFACLCLIGISFNLQSENPDFITKVFYFALHLRPYGSELSSVYCFIINILCLACIFTFFCLVYQMHKRAYISSSYQGILTVFVVDIPRILSFPLTMNASEIIFDLISKKIDYNYIQATLMSIYLLIFLYILMVCSNTMYSSVFYLSAFFVSTASSIFFHCMNIFLLFAFQVTHSILSEDDANYLISAGLILFGVTLLALCLSNFFMTFSYVTFLFTHSIIQIASGIISIFEIQNLITNYSRIYLIIFYMYVAFYILFSLALSILRKVLKKSFLKIADTENFKKLGNVSNLMLLNYLYFGIQESHECIYNNSFLEYVLRSHPRPVSTMFRIYHILGLLQNPPSKFDDLKQQIHQDRQINQRQRYMLFEIERLIALRTRTQVPQEMESKMSEFEARLAQYQQLRVNFMTEIAHNNDIAFMFLNALSIMKDNMLTNYACSLIEKYPNCPDVIRLYAQYLSIVCQNQVACSRWTTIADDIQKHVLQYADYTHVNVLLRHPKIRVAMMKHETTNTSIQLVKPRPPSILLLPAFNNSHKNYLVDVSRPNNQFSDKKSYADLFVVVFLILFGVYIFTFFIAVFVICKHEDDDVLQTVTFLFSASDYFFSFSQSMLNPLYYIYHGTPATVNSTQVDLDLKIVYNSAWTIFNNLYTKCYEKSNDFKKSFEWIKFDTYPIPSYDVNKTIMSQFEWITSRYTNLLQQIFPANSNYNPNAIELSVFLKTLCVSYDLYMPIISRFVESFDEYSDEVSRKTFNKMIYSFIPSIILGIVIIIIPPFVYRDISKLTKYFPKPEANRQSDHRILRLYLKRDFASFWQIYLGIILSVILILALEIITVFVLKKSSESSRDTSDEKIDFVMADSRVFLSASTALNDLIMTQINRPDFEANETDMIYEINHCINYLTNGSINLIQNPPIQVMFLLVVQLTYQVTPTEMKFNSHETEIYSDIFQKQLIPLMYQRRNDYFRDINHKTMSELILNKDLIIIFLIVCFIIYIYLCFCVIKLHHTVKMLIELLSGLSLSSLNLAKAENIKRNNILDFIERPCAMIDKSSRVIAMNHLWLAYFNETFDDVVGRTFCELSNSMAFTSYDVDGNRLIVMSEIKEEADSKVELKNTKRDLRLIKSVSIPKRFLDVTEGTMEVGFLVVSKITLIPCSNEEISPEVWASDATQMEQWLSERCQVWSNGDYDILYQSFREITIMFGVNEKNLPNLLVLSALNIAVDLLRWAIEWDWNSGPMSACVTISCGQPNKFIFTHNQFTSMESFGPPFEKQMRLRESMELNSIVVCDETAFRIKSLMFGFELEECGDGAYIFMIPNIYRPDMYSENVQS